MIKLKKHQLQKMTQKILESTKLTGKTRDLSYENEITS
jgi:hypothetical protein